MAIFQRPYECLEQLHETELEYHKLMLASGVPIAVPAAMYYCAKYGLNAPRFAGSKPIELFGAPA